ncbi:gfo/Idh/MocA family oxidoreductase [Pseudodesulfovibrio sp. JC047]|uniref:Gfo/Idh/MocA family protein n=1 Tax=Pseudodesulfovibrio sp. JC047 TaxID=2683199 RepID=UPI0013D41648|nr:Gfo/Idh/MocA family oxidoreductase [Pseudodesulfovibrio sp. JC047]NDV20680.1 gfo/Idh/MocA family oxidoreductase [Pseudodesulfovibrio sp. JC047]
MKKIRFGILSTAKIARTKVIPAMQKGKWTEVTAIASRSSKNAQAVADELGITKAYGSYERLLADKQIDAVYIPLPNHLHVKWTLKAMDKGKHVLCEKPMGLTSGEVNRLINATVLSPDVKVMEGFMFRFHPQWVEAKRLVDTGAIGDLVTIQSFFSYFNADPDNIRNKADLGGGGLMDIGCYPVALSRFIFNAQPRRVMSFMNQDPNFGTDRVFSGMLDFNGRISTFTCSTQMAPYQRVNILGTTGRIEILIPFNAPPDEPCTILLQQDGETTTPIELAPCDQYTLQGDAFARAILDDTNPPATLMDAFDSMHVIDALFKSAETGQWERS